MNLRGSHGESATPAHRLPWAAPVGLVFLFWLVGPGAAQAATGGSVSAALGSSDGDGVVSLGGRIEATGPAGRGFQIEGLTERIGDTDFIGFGGHLFHPIGEAATGGLFAGYGQFDDPDFVDVDVVTAGVEGLVYAGPMRLTAQVGGIDTDPGDTEALIVADAIWLGGDWTLGGGGGDVADSEWVYLEGALRIGRLTPGTWGYAGTVLGDSDSIYGGVNWRPDALARWSLFAEVAVGDNDYDQVLAGIRLGFGQRITLPGLSIFDPVTRTAHGVVPSSNRRMTDMVGGRRMGGMRR